MDERAFRTLDGRPVSAVTAAEMRTADRVAVESFDLAILQMMEHAGRAIASTVRERSDGDVVVLAGNGGNGGGALCGARHLANRGVTVRVVLDRSPTDLDGPAGRHRRTLDRMGVPIDWGRSTLEGIDPVCVVDGLIGYGLTGPVTGVARELIEVVGRLDAPVVSLDVPSGIDATTGERHDGAIDPDRVLTLALPKTGLRDVSCPIDCADIGIPAAVFEEANLHVESSFDDEYVVQIRPDDER